MAQPARITPTVVILAADVDGHAAARGRRLCLLPSDAASRPRQRTRSQALASQRALGRARAALAAGARLGAH